MAGNCRVLLLRRLNHLGDLLDRSAGDTGEGAEAVAGLRSVSLVRDFHHAAVARTAAGLPSCCRSLPPAFSTGSIARRIASISERDARGLEQTPCPVPCIILIQPK